MGLLAAAYSRPPLARALCLATTASALFTVIGPNMSGMGLDSRAGWLPALFLAVAAVAVLQFGLGPGASGQLAHGRQDRDPSMQLPAT